MAGQSLKTPREKQKRRKMNDANATNVSDEDLERSVNKVHLSLNLKDSDLDKDQLKMQYKKRAEFWSNFMDKVGFSTQNYLDGHVPIFFFLQ